MNETDARDEGVGRLLRETDWSAVEADTDVEAAWAEHGRRFATSAPVRVAQAAGRSEAATRRTASVWPPAGRRLSLVGAVALVFTVAVVGAVVVLQSRHAGGEPPHRPVPPAIEGGSTTGQDGTTTHRRLALEAAKGLLTAVQLPPGCTPASSPLPVGAADAWGQDGAGDAPAVALAESCFVSSASATAATWVEDHRPAGSFWAGSHGTPTVVWGWWPTAVFPLERDTMIVAAHGPGKTEVTAVATVAYRPDRPAAEEVPAGVTSAQLFLAQANGRTAVTTVRGPQLASLESLLDGLPVSVTTTWSVSVPGDTDEEVRVNFFRGSTVVAETTEMPAAWPTTLKMVVAGHAQPLLDDPSGLLWQFGEHTLGPSTTPAGTPAVISSLAARLENAGPESSVTWLSTTETIADEVVEGGSAGAAGGRPAYVLQVTGEFQPNVPAPPGAAVDCTHELVAFDATTLQDLGSFGCSWQAADLASAGPTATVQLGGG